jgi:hypothetical protein
MRLITAYGLRGWGGSTRRPTTLQFLWGDKMMSNVIDLAEYQQPVGQPTTFAAIHFLDDLTAIRLELTATLIALRLDPAEFVEAEIGEVCDAIIDAANDLRDRLAAIPGIIVV